MMMRYLGTGVGHLQPVDFPSELDAITPLLDEELEIPEIAPPTHSPPSRPNEPQSEDDDGEADSDEPLDAQDIESGDEGESGEEGSAPEEEEDDDYDF